VFRNLRIHLRSYYSFSLDCFETYAGYVIIRTRQDDNVRDVLIIIQGRIFRTSAPYEGAPRGEFRQVEA